MLVFFTQEVIFVKKIEKSLQMTWRLTSLPYDTELETRTILKSLPSAHAALAELKGLVYSIPNHEILLNTLAIQEAKDSSAVENIITTHDELFK